MKAPDISSTLVAGVIGAVVLIAYEYFNTNSNKMSTTESLAIGFLLGATVQVGVRLTGAS